MMAENYKRLYRSRKERMIAGVCGGVGEYFGIDPTLVRLLFVVAALFGGPGLLLYLLMMIVVPEEPLEQPLMTDQPVQAESDDTV
jgi:phage shock protein C